MKFLHTSDWHLGARLGEFSRIEEQKAVLEEIREAAESEAVDFVLIAGDIFDTFNPPNEAVELLYRELKKLAADGRRPVVVIAGNHDSPDRIEAPDPLAAECGIFFIGYPDFVRGETRLESGIRLGYPEPGIIQLNIPGRPEVRILVTPYANENRLRKQLDDGSGNREQAVSNLLGERWSTLAGKYCDDKGVNILAAHLFMTSAGGGDAELQPDLFGEPAAAKPVPAEPDEERSILHPGGLEMIDSALVPGRIQYTALGHLHRPQTVRGEGSPAVYSGSPLAFGLSEENQQKSVVIVEVDPGKAAEVSRRKLKSGRRILRRRFSGTDEAAAWLRENGGCFVELLIECDDYISAAERRTLYDAHDGVTAVIPVSRAGSDPEAGASEAPDLNESMEELFISFFRSSKGFEPDPAVLGLFREIAAVTGGDTAEGEVAGDT